MLIRYDVAGYDMTINISLYADFDVLFNVICA